MNQHLDEEALKHACLEVARNIAWRDGPVNDVLARAYAELLVEEAKFHEQYLTGQGRDPNIITRAVSYLAHAHAIPPSGVDVTWFREMLTVVVELSCPNSQGRKEDELLYRDIEEGLANARRDYAT